jgi:quinoprotein glucose dehydrogenase
MPSTRGPEPTERTMWGISPIDQLWCRVRFRKMQYFGPLTPFGTKPTLMNPGAVGANSWGSVAIDKDRGLMIMNSMHLVGWGQLITRKQADRIGLKLGLSTVSGKLGEGFEIGHEAGAFPQAGTAYGAFYAEAFRSPLDVPCSEPPFGSMSAVDLNTGKLVWTKPFGLADKSGPWGLKSFLPLTIGTPNTGGTIATRGGVSFVGAAQDARFRAFETATGKQLWSHQLPAGAMSTPSTYISARSGRQFVVVAASGHAYIKAPPGDYVVAFALPRKNGQR